MDPPFVWICNPNAIGRCICNALINTREIKFFDKQSGGAKRKDMDEPLYRRMQANRAKMGGLHLPSGKQGETAETADLPDAVQNAFPFVQ